MVDAVANTMPAVQKSIFTSVWSEMSSNDNKEAGRSTTEMPPLAPEVLRSGLLLQ